LCPRFFVGPPPGFFNVLPQKHFLSLDPVPVYDDFKEWGCFPPKATSSFPPSLCSSPRCRQDRWNVGLGAFPRLLELVLPVHPAFLVSGSSPRCLGLHVPGGEYPRPCWYVLVHPRASLAFGSGRRVRRGVLRGPVFWQPVSLY